MTPLAGSIVTFYSYKGGVGRTMALANVAVTLAQNGFRTLVVDLDLLAPGVQDYPLFREAVDSSTRYIPPGDRILGQGGILDLVERQLWSMLPTDVRQHFPDGDYRFREEIRPSDENKDTWRKWVRRAHNHAPTSGYVDIIPAGPADHRALDLLAQIGWYRFLTEFDGLKLILSMRDQWWRDDYDFTLIDSRTGLSDYLQFCVGMLPDVAVILAGLNKQNVQGLHAALDSLKGISRHSDLYVLPVLSLIPSGDLDLLQSRFADAENSLQEAQPSANMRFLGEPVRLPYVSTLAVAERLVVPRDHHAPIFREYVRIAEMLARYRFAEIDNLLNEAIYEGAATGLKASDVIELLDRARDAAKQCRYMYGLIRCEKLNAQRLAYGEEADRRRSLEFFPNVVTLIRQRRGLKPDEPWQKADPSIGHWQIELETLVFYARILAATSPGSAVQAFTDALDFLATFEKRNHADMFSDRDWDRYSHELLFTRAFCHLGRLEAQISAVEHGAVPTPTLQANFDETRRLFAQLMPDGINDGLKRRLERSADAVAQLG